MRCVRCFILHIAEIYPDLGALVKHGLVCIFPIGGSASAVLWQKRLDTFSRPEIHVLDSDRTHAGAPLKQEVRKYQDAKANSAENRHIFVLDRRELENYLTPEAFIWSHSECKGEAAAEAYVKANGEPWDYIDLPEQSAKLIHELHGSNEKDWASFTKEEKRKKEGPTKKRLAKAFAHPSMSKLHAPGEQVDLLGILRLIGEPRAHSGRAFNVSARCRLRTLWLQERPRERTKPLRTRYRGRRSSAWTPWRRRPALLRRLAQERWERGYRGAW